MPSGKILISHLSIFAEILPLYALYVLLCFICHSHRSCDPIFGFRVWDLTLGIIGMISLYLLKTAKERWSKSKENDQNYVRVLRKVLWFVATGKVKC